MDRVGFNNETIRQFIESYNQTGKLSKKRGHQKTVLQEEVDGIVGATEAHCQTTLSKVVKKKKRKKIQQTHFEMWQKRTKCNWPEKSDIFDIGW